MKNYFGITIGPIFKTLEKAKKTRELWAASYLFSYLMKLLIKEFKAQGATFIVPYIGMVEGKGDSAHDILSSPNEAGIFADRCVFFFPDKEDLKLDTIEKHILIVKGKIFESINHHLKAHHDASDSEEAHDAEKAKNYFFNYFQIYAVSKSFDTRTSDGHQIKTGVLVKELFDILDLLELQNHFVQIEDVPYIESLLTYLSFRRGKDSSFLVQDAYGDQLNNLRFESIIEIAAKELIEKLDSNDKMEFLKMIGNDDDADDTIAFLAKKKPDLFKTYHKYIAIIHIDGDGIGKCLVEMEDENYGAISKALMEYSLDSSSKIKDFGGVPIYLGGDDALFFAPLRYKEKDLFHLLDDLDQLFLNKMSPFKLQGKVSLSVGISVGYYKQPLLENLLTSRLQLFETAKKHEFVSGKKDAVALNFRKHSGQQFTAVFQKNTLKELSESINKNNSEGNQSNPNVDKYASTAYALFKSMVRANIEDGEFLSAVINHLGRDWPLIKNEEMATDPKRLHHLFANMYNEPVHQQDAIKNYLSKLEYFIPAILQTNLQDKQKDQIYGGLRIVKFLNREDND